MKNDIFANIAAAGIGGRTELLEKPAPKKFTERAVLLSSGGTPAAVPEKLSTRAGLAQALEQARRQYAPFLRDLAPKQEPHRERMELKNFTLYRENAEPEQVTLPHYGGPVGKNEMLYDTQFSLSPEQTAGDKAIYVCVGGADYLARVYVNGACVGEHEGFFSPFEFDISDYVNRGANTLRIQLMNDYVFMGNKGMDGVSREGEKLYAATGLGWDDPEIGWHHCQPGTGLYKDVAIEVRERIHISDLWARPLCGEKAAELWIEVQNADYSEIPVKLEISVYGQNREQTVVEGLMIEPTSLKVCGLGDTFSAAIDTESYGKGLPMPAEHGKNIYKVRVPMKDALTWDLETPYLYQAQVKLHCGGRIADEARTQFGMRSFTQDNEGKDGAMKGMFYLNGRSIRLRGANTMGFEQQDVLRGDIDQLIDDILLAKLCNMNFFRLTQRPVQDEVYTYCDRLGLMTQTDLPLFSKMRRTKFAEGIRQTEEMARTVRGHVCNTVLSYMNEPTPNAGGKSHRHLTRPEMESFFDACDIAMKLNHPDAVVKHVDGDYDPPAKTLPDNHCYTMWYNGHGIDIGQLHKGHWMHVKPGWYYGCGEFGVEGLDFPEVMRECYPAQWVREPFDPCNIGGAQTGNFHYFFYDGQDSMEAWVAESQRFQAFGVRMMTEAFRRDDRMITNALHLFIDAFPSGWMKTVMDCRRNPKPAYFAYRNALEPIMLSLRTDRFTYYEGERVAVEAHICNDTHKSGAARLRFELYKDGGLVLSGEDSAEITENGAAYSASAVFTAPDTDDRTKYVLRGILLSESGEVLAWNEQPLEVFRHVSMPEKTDVVLVTMLTEDTEVAGETVRVKPCGMGPVHFASRKTGHSAVAQFEPADISYFFDAEEDMITPIATHTFEADGFTPILVGGNTDAEGNWHKVMIAGEKLWQGKRYVICNADLRTENPIAERLRAALLSL